MWHGFCLDAGAVPKPTFLLVTLTSPLLVMLCAACSGDVSTPSAAISISAATLNFPQTSIGDTSTAAALTLSTTAAETIGLADTDTADFPYSTTCAPSLPADAACSITVQFHPNTAGNLYAWLNVNSVSGAKTSVALTGTAVGASPINPASAIDLLEIITAQPNPFEMLAGQTIQLGASAIASGSAQDVTTVATWTTSDPTAATVSSAGLVAAVGPGTVSITATYQGHVASIRVFVTTS